MTEFDTIVSLQKINWGQKKIIWGRTNVDIEALEGYSGLKICIPYHVLRLVNVVTERPLCTLHVYNSGMFQLMLLLSDEGVVCRDEFSFVVIYRASKGIELSFPQLKIDQQSLFPIEILLPSSICFLLEFFKKSDHFMVSFHFFLCND